MGKLLVLRDDKVDGTDTHDVAGFDKTKPTPLPYKGTGDYTYGGAVTSGLNDFVTVGGIPIALVSSGSSLRTDSTDKHNAKLGGSNFQPATADPTTLAFVPPTSIGVGAPAASAGSGLLTIGGVKVLMDNDRFDTCKIDGGKGAATVAASGQDWVTSV